MKFSRDGHREIVVGGSKRTGAEGAQYRRLDDRLLVRFNEPVSERDVFTILDGVIPSNGTIVEKIQEGNRFEPLACQRWVILLKDSLSFNGQASVLAKLQALNAVSDARLIYEPSDSDSGGTASPLLDTIVVDAEDYTNVENKLVALGYIREELWSALTEKLTGRLATAGRSEDNSGPDGKYMAASHRYYRWNKASPPDPQQILQAYNSLLGDPKVYSVDFDWTAVEPYGFAPQTDRSELQWNLDAVNAQEAWPGLDSGNTIKVAVLDSGFDLDHEDLDERYLERRFHFNASQFLSNQAHPWITGQSNDSYYNASFGTDFHGTAVAGIIAALQGNGVGIDGIAQKCRLMPIRLGYDPTAARMVAGLEWAVLRHARVANMSFETVPTDAAITMIKKVHALGLVMVAASGNRTDYNSTTSSDLRVAFPASHPDVIAVGAVDRNRNRVVRSGSVRWESRYAPHDGENATGIDVVAPGVDILSTDTDGVSGGALGDYLYPGGGGTSAAAPHVAGLAGMILAVNPSLGSRDVRSLIQNNAVKIDSYTFVDGFHQEVGHGLIDCAKTINAAKTATPQLASPAQDSQSVRSQDESSQASSASSDHSNQKLDKIVYDAGYLQRFTSVTGVHLTYLNNSEGRVNDPNGGSSTQSLWLRLYLTPDLSEWIEFEQEFLEHSREWGRDISPLGKVTIWLNASARVSHGVSTSAGGFLTGRLLKAAKAAGAQAPAQPTPTTLEQLLDVMATEGEYSSLFGAC